MITPNGDIFSTTHVRLHPFHHPVEKPLPEVMLLNVVRVNDDAGFCLLHSCGNIHRSIYVVSPSSYGL